MTTIDHHRDANLNPTGRDMATATYRLAIRGNNQSQPNEVVTHWQAIGITLGSAYDEALALVGLWDSTFRAKWLDMLPDNYSLESVIARRIAPTPGEYAIEDYESAMFPGTKGSTSVGAQLCPCVTLIPVMGVKSAGRVFLPCVGQTMINLNAPTAPYKTAVSAYFTPAIAFTSFLGGTVQQVIYSRKLNIVSEISAFQLSPVLGYQRKRARPIGSG